MKLKEKSWYPWLVVALLWGVALLNYLDRQMLSTMKAAIMGDISELNTAENFGRLMAVFLWIYGLMSPMAGLIADRISRKWLIIGSLGVWSAVTMTMGFATSFNQLYILRAIMGVSEALYIPAGLALIADYHRGNTRSLAIGIHMTGLYTGQALGGFGATVAHNWSWQTAFQSFGLTGVIYSIVLILLLYEKRTVPSASQESDDSSGGFRSVTHSLSVLLGSMSFWVILFYFATPSFPGWGIKNWLPTLFSENLRIDMSVAGPLSTITIAVSSFIGVLFGGLTADRWITKNIKGRIYTGAIGLTLTIPALILIGFGEGLFSIIGGGILFGIGFGMFDANNMPVLCQFVSPGHRAAGYGLMNMTGVFAGALVTNWLGKSTDTGSLGPDLALLAIPVALAVFLQLATIKPVTADKLQD
ncbi:MAG: MFS transporter [Bacteroidetes bacterium GWE2_41_25]|nr:MAG: MFS transporter [Bacteroidetes bacterium GWA2_40_15]OFX94193.1 MAG: MFS transporter [Bacteroidetes bacterium GWC2_40_22]OFY10033.1 MAG: MFS transporter [Bacteroidetes bacterium GWE2_41_25]HBH85813.1 MFS transporter [Bacteroidales bacterium]HBQ83605.1 MFS transporter [Bacteroidales bacterium]